MVKENFVDQLHLKDIGIVELLFAFTPILCGFSAAGLRLADYMWIIILSVVLIKHESLKVTNYKPFFIFTVYWCIHEFVINFIVDPGYMNFLGYGMTLFSFLCVFSLQNVIDVKKLEGSINWVVVISLIGLIYQWTDVVRGDSVHPLEIPGLQMNVSRMENLLPRPSSFFMEPAAYAEFMLVPMWIALKNKHIWWSIVIVISVFLTTSSTGILTTFIMVGGNFLVNKSNKAKFRGALFAIALFFALTNMNMFSMGLEKLTTVDVETNVRLAQGPEMVSCMNTKQLPLGIPYSTPFNFYLHEAPMADIIIYGESSIYMSTFWFMLLKFGIIGLLLYLNVYYKLFKQYEELFPLIMCHLSILFSSVVNIGVTFLFALIAMLVYKNNSLIIRE